jgi:hypothetical protein
MLRDLGWIWLAIAAWALYTFALLSLGYLGYEGAMLFGLVAKIAVVIIAVAGFAIWEFVVWIKDAPPETEQQLLVRLRNIVVGAFAAVGLVTVLYWLDKTWGSWTTNAVLALFVAVVWLAIDAIHRYVKWRDRRAAALPSP